MTFKGSVLHLLLYNGASILLLGLVASVGLMGAHWPFLFVSSVAVMVPVLLLVTAALHWTNRFSFDDAGGAFRKPGGRRIPYDRVQSILIAERGSVLDIFVRQGRMRITSLAEAVLVGHAQRLRDELAARFPERVHSRSKWLSLLPVGLVLTIVLLGLGGFHAYLYHRHPQLRAALQTVERGSQPAARPRPPAEIIEDLEFIPPKGYRFISEEEGALYFEDRSKGQRLKAVGGIQRPLLRKQAALFRYALGVQNHADLLDLTFRARIGVIPLLLRALELAGMQQAAVYEIGPPMRGYASQGMRGGKEETHVVITGERGEQEVHFFFTGPERLSAAALHSFVNDIRPARGRPGRETALDRERFSARRGSGILPMPYRARTAKGAS